MKFKILKEDYYINKSLPLAINWYLGTDWVKDYLNEYGYTLDVDEASEEVWDELGEARCIDGVVSKDGHKLKVTFVGNIEYIFCFTDPEPSLERYSSHFYNTDELSKYIMAVFEDVYGNK